MKEKHIHIRHIVTVGLIILSGLSVATHANAEEITVSVSGNGSTSNNTATVTSNTTSSVNQSNTANIDNNVHNDADTGNNAASANTGGATDVQTGNANSNTTVDNSNINSNTASVPSGGTSVDTTVSGNGSGSDNTVTTIATNTTTVNQTNNARITNNITTRANTGNNTASLNNGDTHISTGNISASNTIINKNINNSTSLLQGSCDSNCTESSINVFVKNNGAGSDNFVTLLLSNKKNVNSVNLADITNNSILDLNTGGNTANFNNGNVSIQTGNIEAVTTIANENINTNVAEVLCNCVTPTTPTPPGGGNQPSTPPSNPSGGPTTTTSSGGPSGGSSAGPTQAVLAAAVSILPATGSPMLLWITLASLIMFFAGWYLRFRSGCAPGMTIA